MSLGLDGLARRYAMYMLREGLVLDVGCGDGFYAEQLERRGAEVVCLDPLESVLRRSRTMHAAVAVAEYLPFRSGSFDYVLAMFSVRDFLDKARGLFEMKRVARRGVVILDVFNPRNPLLRALFWAYVAAVAPLLGFLASGEARRWLLLYPTLRYMPTARIFERIGGKVVFKLARGVLAVGVLPSGKCGSREMREVSA